MSQKRETIKNPAGTFYAKRDAHGRFTSQDEQHRSLSADARQNAKKTVKPGYGDRGDRHTGSRQK